MSDRLSLILIAVAPLVVVIAALAVFPWPDEGGPGHPTVEYLVRASPGHAVTVKYPPSDAPRRVDLVVIEGTELTDSGAIAEPRRLHSVLAKGIGWPAAEHAELQMVVWRRPMYATPEEPEHLSVSVALVWVFDGGFGHPTGKTREFRIYDVDLMTLMVHFVEDVGPQPDGTLTITRWSAHDDKGSRYYDLVVRDSTAESGADGRTGDD